MVWNSAALLCLGSIGIVAAYNNKIYRGLVGWELGFPGVPEIMKFTVTIG